MHGCSAPFPTQVPYSPRMGGQLALFRFSRILPEQSLDSAATNRRRLLGVVEMESQYLAQQYRLKPTTALLRFNSGLLIDSLMRESNNFMFIEFYLFVCIHVCFYVSHFKFLVSMHHASVFYMYICCYM